jgi:hypothetical protein
MPFAVEDFRDLVRLLEERPEWRTELRRLVLTDELLSLPEQVARFQAQTDLRFQELAEAQKRTEEQVAELIVALRSLNSEVGSLKGDMLEIRFRERAPAYLTRMIRRTHVLPTEELVSLLDGAVDRGQLSEAEAEEVALADLVALGKRREDGAEVYLVVEVSWGVGPEDVTRAAKRAALLAKIGTPTVPVVAGRWVTPDAARLAQTMQVRQLTDGRVRLAE